MKKKVSFITQAAIIAAAYTALGIAFAPISFSAVQFRIAEVLTILPFFTPAAIPGLFVGCIITNLLSQFGIFDIVFGSLATLIAALLTYKLKNNKWLAPMPPVIINAIVIGLMIAVSTTNLNSNGFLVAFLLNVVTVGFGQLVVCYGLGIPLIFALTPIKDKIFKT